jgi:hypothetical protein
VEEAQGDNTRGDNTVQGGVLNEVNFQGGIDKADAQNSRRKPNL